jgi:hypothetical protein
MKLGQIWREKRSRDSTGWKREVRLAKISEELVWYEPSNYQRGTRQVYRPVQIAYFRAGYEPCE